MSITLEQNSKGFFRKQKKRKSNERKSRGGAYSIEAKCFKVNVIEIEKDANIRKV